MPERISLDYPIIGTITNLPDFNSISDARIDFKRVFGGVTQNDVLNNLQMSITDIKSGSKLQYKIFYKPSLETIKIEGADRYEFGYVWEYGGEIIQKSEWRFVEDDRLAPKPILKVRGVQYFDRLLTPEEKRKMYEAGPPERRY